MNILKPGIHLGLAFALAACGTATPAPDAPAPEPSFSAEETKEPDKVSTSAPAEASQDDWISSAVAAIAVDGEGMRGCTGGLRPEIPTFYRAIFEKAAPCVEQALEGSKGLIQFHSTLEAGGGLSEFSITKDELGRPAVAKCLQEAVFEVEYPKIASDVPCVQLHVPVEFR